MGASTLVRLREVSRIYTFGQYDIWVLSDVSLTVRQGEFVSILGPPAAGKTTLLNIIGGLDAPTLGSVLIEGVALHSLRGNALADFVRQRIGYAFQRPNLLPMLTLLENVLLPVAPYLRGRADEAKVRAHWLLEQLNLAGRAESLPASLSESERGYVALARAAISRPPLLLVDEPAGGAEGKALTLLDRIRREEGTAIVLGTRERGVAERADRVLRLDGGELREDGDEGRERWRA